MQWGRPVVVAVLCVIHACGDGADANPCAGPDPHVVVDTVAHQLWVCRDGQPNLTYGIRLGIGGVGKTKEGDGKVPLGEYSLGRPRQSSKYGTFVEIGYPTHVQRSKGYTGSAVGVHGPDRRLMWLGRANNWFDTTDGCVGLATDAEMKRLSDWVTSSGARRILLQ
jgi:L,D-peptidoglycan transpeptidase YkuD (ErfK/YbiS/YcfS/YnhG family)